MFPLVSFQDLFEGVPPFKCSRPPASCAALFAEITKVDAINQAVVGGWNKHLKNQMTLNHKMATHVLNHNLSVRPSYGSKHTGCGVLSDLEMVEVVGVESNRYLFE